MNYEISGKVIKGDGYGRKLGFPTANLETKDALPPIGVYSGIGILEGKEYRAGILINPNGKVEAHLIYYNGDAYGKKMTLEIGEFIRDYKKFENEDKLKNQIAEDLKKC